MGLPVFLSPLQHSPKLFEWLEQGPLHLRLLQDTFKQVNGICSGSVAWNEKCVNEVAAVAGDSNCMMGSYVNINH
jgi:hypothetical protein